MATLLEKAKAVKAAPRKPKAGCGQLAELGAAFAWHKVETEQARIAIKASGQGNVYTRLGSALLLAIRRGEYKLVKVETPNGTD